MRRKKNKKIRVTIICVIDGCIWRIHAFPLPNKTTFMIKTYNGEHNCIKSFFKKKNATSTWIAKQLKSSLKANSHMSY